MKSKLTLLLLLSMLTVSVIYGQSRKNSCNCPKTTFAGTKPDTTFHLSNGKSIVLCGYKNPNSHPTSYSEFVLAVCGQNSIIDFWGATLNCRVNVKKDTLQVALLKNLPVGKDFKFKETVWTIEKIYFSGDKVNRKIGVNRQIKTYNQAEIKAILNDYEKVQPGLDDKKMEIAYKLFIASISGDKTAGRYFKEFKTKFGTLDGAYAEEYNELTIMLAQWNKKGGTVHKNLPGPKPKK